MPTTTISHRAAAWPRPRKPDFFQLHGKETPERVAEIARASASRSSRRLPSPTPPIFARVHMPMRTSPTCCCSTPRRREPATRPGGHGAAFDWQLLRGRAFSRPWLLAGGLNPRMSRAPLPRRRRIHGVDASSGVETAPGREEPGQDRSLRGRRARKRNSLCEGTAGMSDPAQFLAHGPRRGRAISAPMAAASSPKR